MNTDSLYRDITHRAGLILGEEGMRRLAQIRVIVFGVGGVGSWCAEGLVRTGVLDLTLVDPDAVELSNVNRQVQAMPHNAGCAKAEELARRLRAIQPCARIEAVCLQFCEATASAFDLASYDYAVDAVDRLEDKAFLLERCTSAGTKAVSSMGAAGRTDPGRVRIGTIGTTAGCPLARRLRKKLRERGAPLDIPCVYSDESPRTCREEEVRDGLRRPLGSLVHVTAVFGFALAGLVIMDAAADSRTFKQV